jgi:hypothetical protein
MDDHAAKDAAAARGDAALAKRAFTLHHGGRGHFPSVFPMVADYFNPMTR